MNLEYYELFCGQISYLLWHTKVLITQIELFTLEDIFASWEHRKLEIICCAPAVPMDILTLIFQHPVALISEFSKVKHASVLHEIYKAECVRNADDPQSVRTMCSLSKFLEREMLDFGTIYILEIAISGHVIGWGRYDEIRSHNIADLWMRENYNDI
jgi:hypothetical protein